MLQDEVHIWIYLHPKDESKQERVKQYFVLLNKNKLYQYYKLPLDGDSHWRQIWIQPTQEVIEFHKFNGEITQLNISWISHDFLGKEIYFLDIFKLFVI